MKSWKPKKFRVVESPFSGHEGNSRYRFYIMQNKRTFVIYDGGAA